MFHANFIRRQLTRAPRQSILFVLCVTLSIVSLVALRGFGESINRVLLRDARVLNGADIVAQSSFPFSQPLMAQVAGLQQEGQVEWAQVYEFSSMARVTKGDATLFVNLKVVEAGYPFYGAVELASGKVFSDVLRPGTVIAEQMLLDRLALQIGDSVQLGKATLQIADVVVREPDRPLSVFSFGPRIFVHHADLAALDLVKPGSRVNYKLLLKIEEAGALDDLAARLKAVSDTRQEEVETYQTRRTGATFFFNTFLSFLSLVGIFTLLLAGIGIQTALTAFLREQNTTIAIIKTLGATGGFVANNFLGVVAILGGLGTLLGIGLGFGLERIFPWLFANLLPPDVQLAISPRTLIESVLLGVVVVASFTFLPIYQLQELKPSFIFRKEVARLARGWAFYLALLLILAFFVGMVLWQINDRWRGLYFIGGTLGLLAITTGLTWLALYFFRRLQFKELVLRQAQRGLFRPRNASHAIIVTFAAALAVIFAIYLIEENLRASFVQSYPEDTPNVFFIDIQPNQLAEFKTLVGVEAEYYPVVRGTIETINGEPVKRQEEEERRGDNLARPFNLTYREYLLEGEALAEGDALFAPETSAGNGVQVSILDDLLEMYPFQVGDQLLFKIQGVPLAATISSIRTRTTEESIQPFFNFVFPEQALKAAPQSVFTALFLQPDLIRPLQNKVVAQFPNVTVIDATDTIRTLATIVSQLTLVIRFFMLFSVLAGVLIVISSVFATRMARIQEAAYYKVLGATSRFVLTVFTLENLLLGLISALLAVFMAQLGAWLLSRYLLEIPHQPAILASLALLVLTMAVVTLTGMVAARSILRSRPITYLRTQTGEE